ncbi:hypothetical protein [Burkholderia oklahomensis]|uniref:hypothetical protein n=1 Tax=Burkholderia oklahomensis TaxID=342113 RepID=UPI000A4B5687|nr:hypothetical protein [Burkholderia oklahomensis]
MRDSPQRRHVAALAAFGECGAGIFRSSFKRLKLPYCNAHPFHSIAQARIARAPRQTRASTTFHPDDSRRAVISSSSTRPIILSTKTFTSLPHTP